MHNKKIVELRKDKLFLHKKIVLKYTPVFYRSFLFIKWFLVNNITFFNTRLIKQIIKIAPEIRSIKSGIKNYNQKKIIFFSMRQDPPHLAWNSVLEIALLLRGNFIQHIACDGLIRQACNSGHYPNIKRWYCPLCKLYAKHFYKVFPICTSWISNFSTKEDWDYAKNIIENVSIYKYEDIVFEELPIGKFAESSTVHFLRESTIGYEKNYRQIYRDFIIGGIAMVKICKRILKQCNPDIVIMLNGWFISERIMLEVARSRGVRVITYENGFRDDTLYLCENEPIKYRIDDLWNTHGSEPLKKEEEKRLDKYLNEREGGNLGWAKYKFNPQDTKFIKEELKLGLKKKIVVAFTNVGWDSTLSKLNIGFNNLEDWLKSTIKYFIKNPNVYLVIRIHPAESASRVSSRDSIAEKILKIFPSLPLNIKIINPSENINSYTLMKLANIGLVYTSTTGLEMVIKDKPVIVAGNPHYRNKGFTYDANTLEEYFTLLEKLLNCPERDIIKKHRTDLARRYAYRLFFDGCIPFNFVEEKKTGNVNNNIRLNFNSIKELSSNRSKYLDNICNIIIRR